MLKVLSQPFLLPLTLKGSFNLWLQNYGAGVLLGAMTR
jgi:hypothetical protein